MTSTNFVSPGQQRYLRACMVCSIVMTYNRFRDEGCPNCDEFLHLAGSQDQIESCTSQVFEGVITLANPARSWIAKYQRLDGYVPGMYAIKVSGQLPMTFGRLSRTNIEYSTSRAMVQRPRRMLRKRFAKPVKTDTFHFLWRIWRWRNRSSSDSV
ncbi:transcription elongation factor spt4 [Fusarium falciforme]|nr:transcription elongation factor spt4 [Fusarium falciforme]